MTSGTKRRSCRTAGPMLSAGKAPTAAPCSCITRADTADFTGGIGPQSYEEIFEQLPGKLEAIEKQGSPLSVVRYIHNGVDNFPPDVVISRIVRQWNERWAYPKLVVATNAMFFEQLEKQCRDVRTFRGELPDTDYVVGAASTAMETGINRVAHDRLHSAEKFATMASLLADFPARPIRGSGSPRTATTPT